MQQELRASATSGLSSELPSALRVAGQLVVGGFRREGTTGVVLIADEMDEGTSGRVQVRLTESASDARRGFGRNNACIFKGFDGTSAR